jgi:protein TonB
VTDVVDAGATEAARPAVAVTSTAGTGDAIAPRGIRAEWVAMAAVAIVAVVGVPMGARWLRNQMPTQAVNAGAATQPMTVVAKHEPVARQAAVPSAAASLETTAVQPEHAPLPSAASGAGQPPASSARQPRVTSAPKKTGAQATASQPVAPVLEFSPMTVAPLAAPPTSTPPVPEPQQLVAVEAPAGRLFETSEVDQAPRIVTRTEPQLPTSLAGRAVNDVVVVRILVSHTGHPFRVSLLRRSRLGSSVDEAVVAAVKQWTFSPARKRGEAVSCWFNFGVSLAN